MTRSGMSEIFRAKNLAAQGARIENFRTEILGTRTVREGAE
jgi:hypothetical protein